MCVCVWGACVCGAFLFGFFFSPFFLSSFFSLFFFSFFSVCLFFFSLFFSVFVSFSFFLKKNARVLDIGDGPRRNHARRIYPKSRALGRPHAHRVRDECEKLCPRVHDRLIRQDRADSVS